MFGAFGASSRGLEHHHFNEIRISLPSCPCILYPAGWNSFREYNFQMAKVFLVLWLPRFDKNDVILRNDSPVYMHVTSFSNALTKALKGEIRGVIVTCHVLNIWATYRNAWHQIIHYLMRITRTIEFYSHVFIFKTHRNNTNKKWEEN